MAIAAEKGPVDALFAVVDDDVEEGCGVDDSSEVRRLTRFADDAPRREGALIDDWV